MDIQVEIEPVEFDDMANRAPAESSALVLIPQMRMVHFLPNM